MARKPRDRNELVDALRGNIDRLELSGFQYVLMAEKARSVVNLWSMGDLSASISDEGMVTISLTHEGRTEERTVGLETRQDLVSRFNRRLRGKNV